MTTAQRFLISMCESSGRWTWTAVVLLGFLLGIASSYPISNRTNATSLEKRWETLFSRSVLGMSVEKSGLNWESEYLLGIKRVRRLYCNVGIGFHLQVLPDGRINGVHNENQYSELHPEMSCMTRYTRDGWWLNEQLILFYNIYIYARLNEAYIFYFFIIIIACVHLLK